MPKVNDLSIFHNDTVISVDDYLFGTDGDNFKKNRNYKIADLVSFFAKALFEDSTKSIAPISFIYSDVIGDKKFISTPSGILSEITTLEISNTNTEGTTLDVLFDLIKNNFDQFELSISILNNPNIVSSYEITNITENNGTIKSYTFELTNTIATTFDLILNNTYNISIIKKTSDVALLKKANTFSEFVKSSKALLDYTTADGETLIPKKYLEQELANLPTPVESVTGTNIDNTDPVNPIINLQTALQTSVADTLNNFVSTDVETVLAEISTKLTGIAHTAITGIDLKTTANPNEYLVEITWTDSDGVAQTTTDPTPIIISGSVIFQDENGNTKYTSSLDKRTGYYDTTNQVYYPDIKVYKAASGAIRYGNGNSYTATVYDDAFYKLTPKDAVLIGAVLGHDNGSYFCFQFPNIPKNSFTFELDIRTGYAGDGLLHLKDYCRVKVTVGRVTVASTISNWSNANVEFIDVSTSVEYEFFLADDDQGNLIVAFREKHALGAVYMDIRLDNLVLNNIWDGGNNPLDFYTGWQGYYFKGTVGFDVFRIRETFSLKKHTGISAKDALGSEAFKIIDEVTFGEGLLLDPLTKSVSASIVQTIYTNIPYNLNRSDGLRITKTGKLVSINFNSYITIAELDALPTTFLPLFTLPVELRPYLTGHNNIKTIIHGNNGGYFARIFQQTGDVFVYPTEPMYGSIITSPGSELHLNITYEIF